MLNFFFSGGVDAPRNLHQESLLTASASANALRAMMSAYAPEGERSTSPRGIECKSFEDIKAILPFQIATDFWTK